MKPGQESQTAVMVCLARALAHGDTTVAAYSDPTALALLPEEAQQRYQAIRHKRAPQSTREGFDLAAHRVRAKMMVARTVSIDEAIRQAAHSQLVILGAGLDGRAWRMPELAQTTVFEVDHPDSQRRKRERSASLPPTAREIRFVPVDFTRDELSQALDAAGHQSDRPTTWVWEGVVMYLTPAEIASTLAVVARRSAPGSRLIVLYHAPAWMLALVSWVVRRLGEPLRSAFRPAEMARLLDRFGFAVTSDQDLPTLGAALSDELTEGTRHVRHNRLVVAERR